MSMGFNLAALGSVIAAVWPDRISQKIDSVEFRDGAFCVTLEDPCPTFLVAVADAAAHAARYSLTDATPGAGTVKPGSEYGAKVESSPPVLLNLAAIGSVIAEMFPLFVGWSILQATRRYDAVIVVVSNGEKAQSISIPEHRANDHAQRYNLLPSTTAWTIKPGGWYAQPPKSNDATNDFTPTDNPQLAKIVTEGGTTLSGPVAKVNRAAVASAVAGRFPKLIGRRITKIVRVDYWLVEVDGMVGTWSIQHDAVDQHASAFGLTPEMQCDTVQWGAEIARLHHPEQTACESVVVKESDPASGLQPGRRYIMRQSIAEHPEREASGNRRPSAVASAPPCTRKPRLTLFVDNGED